MKSLLIALAIGTFAVTAAASTSEVEGNTAKAIIASLEHAGAFLSCGLGTCGTFATDVQCEAKVINQNELHFSCTLRAQDNAGSTTPVDAQGRNAHELFNALLNANIPEHCANHICDIAAQEIKCFYTATGVSPDVITYRCSLTY